MSNNSGSKQLFNTSTDLESLRKSLSNLRDICDTLEDEIRALKSERQDWEVERLRLKRDLDVKDDTLNDLTRDFSLRKEAELKAIKRYDKALDYNREVEEKMDQLRRGFDLERDEFLDKLSDLKQKLIAKEDEFVDLAVERANWGALNEELKDKLREKEEKINDLVKESKNVNVWNEDWIREKARLEAIVREKEVKIDELSRRNKDLEDVLSGSIGALENEMTEIKNKHKGKIEQLEKEKEGLERENREILANYKMVKDSVGKLEEDVVEHFCLMAKCDRKFKSSKIGRIVSGIMDALDMEQECTVKEEVDIGGNLKDPAFVSHASGLKCSSVTKSEEAAKTTVLSEEELSGENGPACIQKSQYPTYIQLSDSDDDDVSCHFSGLKRERASMSFIQKHSDGRSSDGSVKKPKTKKLEHLLSEPAKHGPPISASDHMFSTPLKQTMPFIRECKENLSRKVKEPRLEVGGIFEYIGKIEQNQEKNVLNSAIDVAVACREDSDFCVKAICTLYRNGLLCSGQGVEKCDMDRLTALAEYLIKSDPNSDKSSVDALVQRDPGVTKLVANYSEQLYEIFKSNVDPLFSHKSPDMQYKLAVDTGN